MKTKNILKIGVLSIILLILLISPVLKLNLQEASANFGIGGVWHSIEESQRELVRPGERTLCQHSNDECQKLCMDRYGWKAATLGCYLSCFFQDMWCVITRSILEGLGNMFGNIISQIIQWITLVLDPALYGGFATNEATIEIWTMFRDLVNLILIIGIIVIALATILGYKKYSWNNILWKLLVVALLVNFSLVIAGTIMDISNALTKVALNRVQGDNDSLASRFLESFTYRLQDETGPNGEQVDLYKHPEIFSEEKDSIPLKEDYDEAHVPSTSDGYNYSLTNFFIIVFILILIGGFAVLSLLAVLITVFARNIFLIVLLSLSSIAFACWIFPDTEKYWKLWWSQFIKWCIFPIIFSFSLLLGFLAMESVSEIGFETGIIETIIQMILYSMFLVGGLIFSIQSGGAVSGLALKQVNKIGLALGGAAGMKALKGVTGSEPWKKAQERLEKSRLAPIHDLGVSMGKMPAKIRENELKSFEDNYKKMSVDEIRSDLEVHKKDKARVAIGLSQLAERKSIDYNKDYEFVKKAQGQPSLNVSNLKKAHPELYAEFFTPDMEDKITSKLTTMSPTATRADAKNSVIKDLLAEQVRKSSPENIKDGNWADITKRLQAKRLSDEFFGDLLDQELSAGKLANMINSIHDSDELNNFKLRFQDAVTKKMPDGINVQTYLQSQPGYKKNPTIKNLFNL
jgi:hypothetical protein